MNDILDNFLEKMGWKQDIIVKIPILEENVHIIE